jgi:hypothetical protein
MQTKIDRHIAGLRVGNRVAYSAAFARVLGSYELATRRGKLASLDAGRPFGFVLWDDGESQHVALQNIAKVGSVAFSDPSCF